MIIYLNADCVFAALEEKNIIKGEKWKRASSFEKYPVNFHNGFTKGSLSFEVHVENDVHLVSAFYLSIIERFYNIDLSVIATQCAI